MTKALIVVGVRPQFIKASALSRAIAADLNISETLVHTGQHHADEMFGVFFRELGLRQPDINLGVSGGSRGHMTGRMLERLEPVIVAERPDVVVVFGDTNSTLAGALVTAKVAIPHGARWSGAGLLQARDARGG